MLSKQTIIPSPCSQKAATMELRRGQMVGWRTAKVLLPSKVWRNLWHFFTSRIVRHPSGLISSSSHPSLRCLLGDWALHLAMCVLVQGFSTPSAQIYHRLIFLLLSLWASGTNSLWKFVLREFLQLFAFFVRENHFFLVSDIYLPVTKPLNTFKEIWEVRKYLPVL